MFGGLERKLLAYFLLIALAALMIGIEFVFEMDRPDLKIALWENMSQVDRITDGQSIDHAVFAPLAKLRTKIVVMFGVLTVVVAIVLMMFIRYITMPLQKMVDAAEKINEGDLSQVIEVTSEDEISQLGIAINELTSNLQEIAAFTHQASEQMLTDVSELKEAVAAGETPDASQLEALEVNLQSLIEVAGSFELFEIDIEKFN